MQIVLEINEPIYIIHENSHITTEKIKYREFKIYKGKIEEIIYRTESGKIINQEELNIEKYFTSLEEINKIIDLKEKNMDQFFKIAMRLLTKFEKELNAEYGSAVIDKILMLDKLYKEQSEIMLEPWHNYCCKLEKN